MASRSLWQRASALVVLGVAVLLGAAPAAAASDQLRLTRPDLSVASSASVLATVPPVLSGYPLPESAFSVESEGHRLPARVSRVIADNVDVVLLVDTGSGAATLQAEAAGAADLLRSLPPSANARVVATHDPKHPSQPGRDAGLQFLAALRPVPGGSVSSALTAVAGSPASRPRRVILLAGCPGMPAAQPAPARLGAGDQQLDVVGYGTGCNASLRHLAERTGGVAVSASAPTAYVGLADTALATINGQYRLTFPLTAKKAAPVSITVAAGDVRSTATITLGSASGAGQASRPAAADSSAFVHTLRIFVVILAVLLLLLVAVGLGWVMLRRRSHSPWPRLQAAARANRLEIGLFAGIAAIASALRLWDLGRVGFRGDEAVYAGQAAILAGDHSMERYFILASRGNSNFLLYQEILAVIYRLFGVSDVAARLVSAVFSVLTVVAVYFLARLLYGRRAAVFGAGALALSGYAVGLGRLALLDSTATFFIVLSVTFLALWLRTPETKWLCGFAVATTLAAQAKVAGVLLLVVFTGVLVINGAWRNLSRRSILLAVLGGLVALVPALIQVAVRPATIVDFLGSSLQRRSAVPWYYYGNALVHAEGAAIVIALAAGLVLTAARPRRADVLPWLWLAVFGVFFLVYPLKAFNYLLPLVPALALLAGRGLASLRLRRFPRLAVPVAVAVVCSLFAAPALASAVRDDSSAGVREAARWIGANAPRSAGVMTLSQGSGQYVYSFYAERDAYPYGRFRLATVLPGGKVFTPAQTPAGHLPLDWISDRPEKLIQDGTVSYLVYATGSLDDPPEQDQILNTQTQRQFRSLIESFGGQLVHKVTWNHEVRAYVYKVTKRQLHPAVTFTVAKGLVNLQGTGFIENSTVNVTYNLATLASARSDANGSVAIAVRVPKRTQRPYHLVLTDTAGNYASARGLPAPAVKYAVTGGKLVIAGQNFSAGAPVTVTYHEKTLTRVTAAADGTVSAQLPLPSALKPRYQLRLTDSYGLTAWTVGIVPPAIRFTVTGTSVRVTGQHFLPSAAVVLSYHGQVVGRPVADAAGAFGAQFALPANSQRSYQLIAVDSGGSRAVAVGLVRGR